jgi:hypothetical protein
MARMFPHVLASKIARGDVPPNLRRGNAVESCMRCTHFDGVRECVLHGWPVSPGLLSDDFEPGGLGDIANPVDPNAQ